MKTNAKKVTKTVVNVLLWIFLAFALLMTILAYLTKASTSGVSQIGDHCYLCVQSDSMKGDRGFNKGDLIICRMLKYDEKSELQVDDVITYLVDLDGDGKEELNTHRVYERVEDSHVGLYYKTAGDNTHDVFDASKVKVDDWDVKIDKIICIWEGKKIGGVGFAIDFLQSSTGFLCCIVLPLLVFFIYEVIALVMSISEVKNKGKKQITEADEELIKQKAIEEYLARHNAENSDNSEKKDSDSD